MGEYSIHTANGKVLGDSVFFLLAHDSLAKECQRLCDFTDALDKEPAEKKENIAEYKCAKYRYASVARIHNLLYHGYRVYQNSAIHMDIENCIGNNDQLFDLCNNAADDEKIDFKLYYGISFIAQEMNTMYSERLLQATDWEKVELEERIGGLLFAKECLDEAWQKRKDVAE